jgi:hypothetical protein
VVGGYVGGEVRDELGRDIDAEARHLLGTLSLGDGKVKSEQGTPAQFDWLLERVNEDQMLQVRKAAQNTVPIISRRNVARLATEDSSEFRGLYARHDEQVLAERADALQGSDDVISVNAVDFVVNHHAVEDCRVGDRLLALPEWGQTANGVRGEGQVAMALVALFGEGQKNIELRLVRECGSAHERQLDRPTGAQKRLLWGLSSAPLA